MNFALVIICSVSLVIRLKWQIYVRLPVAQQNIGQQYPVSSVNSKQHADSAMAQLTGHAALLPQPWRVYHDPRTMRLQAAILGILVRSRPSVQFADYSFVHSCYCAFHLGTIDKTVCAEEMEMAFELDATDGLASDAVL